uniref:Uncharacterized protein n=1 Tax=Chromera velia CCMP2878 TaxID=1169474 RepID=A0A0G4GYF9_9ALVE|eukprot:Cvel_23907.t1-p1 / transcript=Cvel_23907.t1 / gene=Cvel_23907 / organism=Chromera_velia_CCMP2878 / gene_product=hypothetical protein / transcript_product=hypothetical protein / location=Cvel_scaffold2521:11086-18789(-) / protein_length=1776 / sequence_SO=supercontig / SO=protein_coding / is_pseudo=false
MSIHSTQPQHGCPPAALEAPCEQSEESAGEEGGTECAERDGGSDSLNEGPVEGRGRRQDNRGEGHERQRDTDAYSSSASSRRSCDEDPQGTHPSPPPSSEARSFAKTAPRLPVMLRLLVSDQQPILRSAASGRPFLPPVAIPPSTLRESRLARLFEQQPFTSRLRRVREDLDAVEVQLKRAEQEKEVQQRETLRLQVQRSKRGAPDGSLGSASGTEWAEGESQPDPTETETQPHYNMRNLEDLDGVEGCKGKGRDSRGVKGSQIEVGGQGRRGRHRGKKGNGKGVVFGTSIPILHNISKRRRSSRHCGQPFEIRRRIPPSELQIAVLRSSHTGAGEHPEPVCEHGSGSSQRKESGHSKGKGKERLSGLSEEKHNREKREQSEGDRGGGSLGEIPPKRSTPAPLLPMSKQENKKERGGVKCERERERLQCGGHRLISFEVNGVDRLASLGNLIKSFKSERRHIQLSCALIRLFFLQETDEKGGGGGRRPLLPSRNFRVSLKYFQTPPLPPLTSTGRCRTAPLPALFSFGAPGSCTSSPVPIPTVLSLSGGLPLPLPSDRRRQQDQQGVTRSRSSPANLEAGSKKRLSEELHGFSDTLSMLNSPWLLPRNRSAETLENGVDMAGLTAGGALVKLCQEGRLDLEVTEFHKHQLVFTRGPFAAALVSAHLTVKGSQWNVTSAFRDLLDSRISVELSASRLLSLLPTDTRTILENRILEETEVELQVRYHDSDNKAVSSLRVPEGTAQSVSSRCGSPDRTSTAASEETEREGKRRPSEPPVATFSLLLKRRRRKGRGRRHSSLDSPLSAFSSTDRITLHLFDSTRRRREEDASAGKPLELWGAARGSAGEREKRADKKPDRAQSNTKTIAKHQLRDHLQNPQRVADSKLAYRTIPIKRVSDPKKRRNVAGEGTPGMVLKSQVPAGPRPTNMPRRRERHLAAAESAQQDQDLLSLWPRSVIRAVVAARRSRHDIVTREVGQLAVSRAAENEDVDLDLNGRSDLEFDFQTAAVTSLGVDVDALCTTVKKGVVDLIRQPLHASTIARQEEEEEERRQGVAPSAQLWKGKKTQDAATGTHWRTFPLPHTNESQAASPGYCRFASFRRTTLACHPETQAPRFHPNAGKPQCERLKCIRRIRQIQKEEETVSGPNLRFTSAYNRARSRRQKRFLRLKGRTICEKMRRTAAERKEAYETFKKLFPPPVPPPSPDPDFQEPQRAHFNPPSSQDSFDAVSDGPGADEATAAFGDTIAPYKRHSEPAVPRQYNQIQGSAALYARAVSFTMDMKKHMAGVRLPLSPRDSPEDALKDETELALEKGAAAVNLGFVPPNATPLEKSGFSSVKNAPIRRNSTPGRPAEGILEQEGEEADRRRSDPGPCSGFDKQRELKHTQRAPGQFDRSGPLPVIAEGGSVVERHLDMHAGKIERHPTDAPSPFPSLRTEEADPAVPLVKSLAAFSAAEARRGKQKRAAPTFTQETQTGPALLPVGARVDDMRSPFRRALPLRLHCALPAPPSDTKPAEEAPTEPEGSEAAERASSALGNFDVEGTGGEEGDRPLVGQRGEGSEQHGEGEEGIMENEKERGTFGWIDRGDVDEIEHHTVSVPEAFSFLRGELREESDRPNSLALQNQNANLHPARARPHEGPSGHPTFSPQADVWRPSPGFRGFESSDEGGESEEEDEEENPYSKRFGFGLPIVGSILPQFRPGHTGAGKAGNGNDNNMGASGPAEKQAWRLMLCSMGVSSVDSKGVLPRAFEQRRKTKEIRLGPPRRPDISEYVPQNIRRKQA